MWLLDSCFRRNDAGSSIVKPFQGHYTRMVIVQSHQLLALGLTQRWNSVRFVNWIY